MFGVLFEFLIYIFCLRDADLKPLLHTVTAFPVSAGERGVCPKACRCIYSLHLTGGSLIQLRVWLQTEFTPPRRGRVEGVVWDWASRPQEMRAEEPRRGAEEKGGEAAGG